MAIKLHPSLAVHPGRWLKADVVDHYAMTVSRVASLLGVTRPAMSNLLNGKAAFSPEMAIRFEKGFGVPAATMLRMQASWDLAQVQFRAHEIIVERVPEAA